MRGAHILCVMNTDGRTCPATPRRLQWTDETEAPPETSAESRQLQREFWAKFTPAIFDTRCVNYPLQQMEWD